MRKEFIVVEVIAQRERKPGVMVTLLEEELVNPPRKFGDFDILDNRDVQHYMVMDQTSRFSMSLAEYSRSPFNVGDRVVLQVTKGAEATKSRLGPSQTRVYRPRRMKNGQV